VRDVAQSPGEYQKWNEMDIGLARIRKGDDIYYTGLTGPMLLGQCGDRLQGMKSDFSVANGRIVEE
jgi:hypothetical protein